MAQQESSPLLPQYRVLDYIPQPAQNKILNLLYLKQINKIACLYSSGLITLLDADSYQQVKSFKAHCGSITTAIYNSKLCQLITQYGGEIKMWDLFQVRSTEINQINIDFSVINSMELLKKENAIIVAGELKSLRRSEKFDTLYNIDIKTREVAGQWEDSALILTTQKLRYDKENYLIACGFSNGYIKLFSCAQKSLRCVLVVKAHKDEVTKLHSFRIKDHPFIVSESNDQKIKLWNVSSKLLCLRSLHFTKKKSIAGSLSKEKIIVLFDEKESLINFVNIVSGEIVQNINIGGQSIRKGITLKNKEKVILLLENSQLLFLGIKNK